jgi:hypothetical protein
MSNEIDRLMDEDPLNLSAQDIDDIIAYQRKMKANFDAGVKSGKGKTLVDAPKIDLQSLLKASIAQSGTPQVQVTRRR